MKEQKEDNLVGFRAIVEGIGIAAQTHAPKTPIHRSGNLRLAGRSGNCSEERPQKVIADATALSLLPRERFGGGGVEQFGAEAHPAGIAAVHRRMASWRLNSSRESAFSGEV